jgi:serine/threonine protein kinase
LGIIHNDIKPHNILIDESMDVKVCDFGLSTYSLDYTMLHFSTIQTIGFRAPEIISSETIDIISPKTDVWALGSVMWFIYAGNPLLVTRKLVDGKFVMLPNHTVIDDFYNEISRGPLDSITTDEICTYLSSRDDCVSYPHMGSKYFVHLVSRCIVPNMHTRISSDLLFHTLVNFDSNPSGTGITSIPSRPAVGSWSPKTITADLDWMNSVASQFTPINIAYFNFLHSLYISRYPDRSKAAIVCLYLSICMFDNTVTTDNPYLFDLDEKLITRVFKFLHSVSYKVL